MAMAALRAIFAAMGVASLLLAFAAADVKFGYSGAIGPDKWESLSPAYHLCSSGKQQSPINIVKDDLVYNSTLTSLERDYAPTNSTLIDNGFNIELRYENGAGTVLVNGKKYTLHQIHWHTPSEHTINGQRYPIELHLVHQSDDGNVTVISILYQYGHPDPFLFQIKEKVDELAKEAGSGVEEAHVPVGVVQTRSLKRNTRTYYRYVGSLTIPPCTENVIWNILGKVRTISKEQVAALQAPLTQDYRNNSRPLQPLNARIVALYDEGQKNKSNSL